MLDKEKVEEIEYYTYLESIIENIEININRIEKLEKSNKKLKLNITVAYIFIVLLIIVSIVCIYLSIT